MRAIIGKPLDLSFIPGWPEFNRVFPIIPEGDLPVQIVAFEIHSQDISLHIRELWHRSPVIHAWSNGWDIQDLISAKLKPLGYDIDWTVIDGSL